MDKIQIRTAFVWDCVCGAENFEHAVEANISAEDIERMYRDANHIQAWENVDELAIGANVHFVHAPLEVTCKDCGTEFSTFDETTLDDENPDSYDM